MFVATKNKKLATTTTGALPRPRWYTASFRNRPFLEAMSDGDFREQYLDAVSSFIRDQDRAGIDIVTDGDARHDIDIGGASWYSYPALRLDGVSPPVAAETKTYYGESHPGDILFEIAESRGALPIITGKLGRGQLHYTDLWRLAQRMTEKPVKFGAISAQNLLNMLGDTYYKDRKTLLMEGAAAFNEELKIVARAGCQIIQIEAPSIFHHDAPVYKEGLTPGFFVKAANREVEGLRALTEVWCHTCMGSPAAQKVPRKAGDPAAHFTRYTREALKQLNDLDVDVITFETATDKGVDIEAICTEISPDKKICIGGVSHRTLQVERPEEVAELIRAALKYVPPERLIVGTDCGFGREGMGRRHAFFKMVSLVRGTNIVRRELGLPEVSVLAADPRFSFEQA
jgi:5-methyltetrahydropteroyltriglutamate--homocysteine methyltransferase